jgi:hypothetical protein
MTFLNVNVSYSGVGCLNNCPMPFHSSGMLSNVDTRRLLEYMLMVYIPQYGKRAKSRAASLLN